MSAPKEHPIQFSAPMVRAILDNRKTQTRRVMNPQPPDEHDFVDVDDGEFWFSGICAYNAGPCPYGQPGDRLWVRETFTTLDCHHGEVRYRATASANIVDVAWKPSIFMPRLVSRLTLEIVSVSVERLQDITRDDCGAEGLLRGDDGSWLGPLDGTPDFPYAHAHEAYAALWDSLNAQRGFGWDKNPWVFVIDFGRIKP